MKELLLNVLRSFGYPVYLQGTMNASECYPDIFITYITNDVPVNTSYDNDAAAYAWDFYVILYSNSAATLKVQSTAIRTALKNSGFIPRGKGRDIPSDEKTHTGWAMEFNILEYGG